MEFNSSRIVLAHITKIVLQKLQNFLMFGFLVPKAIVVSEFRRGMPWPQMYFAVAKHS